MIPHLPSCDIGVNVNQKMSSLTEMICDFLDVNMMAYIIAIHHFTCWFNVRQFLIYQLNIGLTGKNGRYNHSRATHLYFPFPILSNHHSCSLLTMTVSKYLMMWISWYANKPLKVCKHYHCLTQHFGMCWLNAITTFINEYSIEEDLQLPEISKEYHNPAVPYSWFASNVR